MKKIFIILITIILLSACSEIPNPIKEIRKDDILKYGISYEADRLFQLGIEGITIDKDGTIHFYVQDLTPDTHSKIEKGLIEIFGQTFDFVLHPSDELYIGPDKPPVN